VHLNAWTKLASAPRILPSSSRARPSLQPTWSSETPTDHQVSSLLWVEALIHWLWQE
jgi:hypothetical protein